MTHDSIDSASASVLTTRRFWNAQWTDRARRQGVTSAIRARFFGARGTFLRTMDAYAPGVFDNVAVCELGGASSQFLVALARHRGSKVTAIDYSEVGIRATEELFRQEHVAGSVILADMFALDEFEGSFDAVVHWGLLEHFQDPTAVLEVSAKLLRPGGTLVYTMPNLKAAGVSLWRTFSPTNLSAHLYHDDDLIASATRAAGLVPVRNFTAGPPLLRMAAPERLKPLGRIVDVAHAAALIAGTAFPGLYVHGTPTISQTRGFVARKPG